MDEVTLILGALAAGAAAAVKDAASQAVKDSYSGLKAMLKDWFAKRKKPEGEMALTHYETKPDVWREPLKHALIETDAGKEHNIIKAVENLKKALEGMDGGLQVLAKYHLNIKNCEIGIVGDNVQVGEINFGRK